MISTLNENISIVCISNSVASVELVFVGQRLLVVVGGEPRILGGPL